MKIYMILLILFLTGCKANNFTDFYNDEGVDKRTLNIQTDYIKIIESSVPLIRIKEYQRKGYVIVGSSYFRGEWCPRNLAVETAKEKGASIVIIGSTLLGMEERKYILAVPVANTTYHQGSINTSWGYGNYSGTSTSWSTDYYLNSYLVANFEQMAIFMAKKKR